MPLPAPLDLPNRTFPERLSHVVRQLPSAASHIRTARSFAETDKSKSYAKMAISIEYAIKLNFYI
jgi:hypothetical protein